MAKTQDKLGQGTWGYDNPYNEVASKDPNAPDAKGDNIYYNGFDEVLKMHLSEGPIFATANSDEGRAMTGGTAPGEPNPANMAQHK